MTEAFAPASCTASATVLKTGMSSCFVPPLPGGTPPTTFVPYSTICTVWNVPSFPVMPCTTRRVDLSTSTLILELIFGGLLKTSAQYNNWITDAQKESARSGGKPPFLTYEII